MPTQAKPVTRGGVMIPHYRTWGYMMDRCYNPEAKDYAKYGGRGITVCGRWRDSALLFSLDIGPKPSPKHQLDRIDHKGGYEPANCRWATAKENGRNKSNNIRITYNGVTAALSEWAEKTGISHACLSARYRKKWTPERMLTTDPALYHGDRSAFLRKEVDCATAG